MGLYRPHENSVKDIEGKHSMKWVKKVVKYFQTNYLPEREGTDKPNTETPLIFTSLSASNIQNACSFAASSLIQPFFIFFPLQSYSL